MKSSVTCYAPCPTHLDRNCTKEEAHLGTTAEDPHDCTLDDGKGHPFVKRIAPMQCDKVYNSDRNQHEPCKPELVSTTFDGDICIIHEHHGELRGVVWKGVFKAARPDQIEAWRVDLEFGVKCPTCGLRNCKELHEYSSETNRNGEFVVVRREVFDMAVKRLAHMDAALISMEVSKDSFDMGMQFLKVDKEVTS